MPVTGDRAGADTSSWRALLTTILLPNLLYGTGQGATLPVIPLLAIQQGASLATAALVTAMLPLGQLIATLPAGWLVDRWGERAAILVATSGLTIGAAACLVVPDPVVLLFGALLIGCAAAVFAMGRHAWITTSVDVRIRGRVLSTVAGFQRLGLMIGPFLSAAVIVLTGHARWAFAIPVLMGALLTLGFKLIPGSTFETVDTDPSTTPVTGIWRTVVERKDVLIRLGTSGTVLAALRTSREVIVPLWGIALGASAAQVALVVGVSAAVDFALFYTGGQIMDRYGRLRAAVPTMLAFAVGHLGLAIAGVVSPSLALYVAFAILMAVGNGLSSGINAAMGSDLANSRKPAAFLSSWRLVTQIGPAGAPFVIATVTTAVSLAAASAVMGVVALGGLAGMCRYVPRYLPHRAPEQRALDQLP